MRVEQIKFTAVKSSNIAGYFYNPKTKMLYIKFRNDRVYAYEQVTQEEMDEMTLDPEKFSKEYRRIIFAAKKYKEIW